MKFCHMRILPKRDGPGFRKLRQALVQHKSKAAWGLDIGGRALKAVKILQKSGRLVVEDMDIIEYSMPSSDANFLQSPGIREAIQTFLIKHHIARSDRVFMSIPGQFILSRFTSIPPVDKKQLKNIVSYEAKQQIPFDLKEIVWDYQQLTEHIPGGESIEIGMFASKRSTLDQLLTNIAPLVPRVTAIQASPLAISNFVSFDRQLDGLTMIINMETENTDLIIVNDRYFWLRSIPASTAENDLVKEIQRSMEYYKSLTKETVDFKTILLMGNKCKDPLNVACITDNFAYDVKVLNTINNVELSGNISPAYFHENVLHLGVALGLALQGVGLSRITINLLPQELIRAAEISKKKPYAITAISCFALSLIIQYSGYHIRIAHLHDSGSRYQKVFQDTKELEKQYKDAENFTKTKKTELDLISSMDSSRFIWMGILDKLLALMPDSVSITSIQSSWIAADSIKDEGAARQASSGASQEKKLAHSGKSGNAKKLLLMGMKGESKEPSMRFIEEQILNPIQAITLFDQKVPAFKNAEIVPGSSRQVDIEDHGGSSISFEIRWIVKSRDEILCEESSASLAKGTSTPREKS